ncbi:MAG: dehydrogenase E1 component subunit alpha/beta [Bacteroidetes bacterium]|nr:dehydrogenase E1 component subunit alpha/beta [Bacteroidota bacterium]MDA1119232.1 dehydrogenase E1 component subunit alpha/beta [Bacteroidota bacterium]
MTITEKPIFDYQRRKLSDKELKEIYTALLKPRLIEEKMLVLLRQGKISKWFSGVGQEAVSVGAALAMHSDEYILPVHRNLGVFTVRDVDFGRLFAQFQGKRSGFTNGRDRSFHFGIKEKKIVGMISLLGPQLALADGIALAAKLKKENKATLVFSGDGGTSEGDFHEALNVAAVWDLPVVFVIENNGYGLSTPSVEQFKIGSFTQKGAGYGIEAIRIEGNNVLEVFHQIQHIAEKVRKQQKPVLVEAMTFRMRGHEEASGTKYVPDELMRFWSKRDPIKNYEKYLLSVGVIDNQNIELTREKIKKEIEAGLKFAFNESPIDADTDREAADLFYPYVPKIQPPTPPVSSKRFVDAISDGLRQSMEKFPELVLMGQDIAEYGGVFKVTEGFVSDFGKDRVRNTPLCESAIIGIALGLSISGIKSMVEMQFADFAACGFNQIINNLAKIHYRWGQNADVVIRMPTGAGVQAGPFHSQSNEAWFFHTPGLRIVYPSNPIDAKGLLCAALEDPNPYLFFEHKALYRSITDDVPDEYYTIEIGKAKLVTTGNDLSIITYGMGVKWAKNILEKNGVSADIVDLRTLAPWDVETVRKSVSKCSRVIILHEDNLIGGIGGEIAAWIAENCFGSLDAPIMRVAALDTPVPFAKSLEENYLPEKRLVAAINTIMAY